MLDASSGLRHEYYPGVRVSYPLPQARVAHGPPGVSPERWITVWTARGFPRDADMQTMRPVWSCCSDGKSNCSIETQRCAHGHFAVPKKVTSAQCSECEGEVVLSSTGKRRE